MSSEDKYCAVCTPLGKLCPYEFPGCQDWDDNSEEREENDQGEGEDNFYVCSDRGADLDERKNQEIENKKDNEGRTPQTNPTSLSATALALQLPKSSIEQSTKRSHETPTEEEEENKCETLTMEMGQESSKSLEDAK